MWKSINSDLPKDYSNVYAVNDVSDEILTVQFNGKEFIDLSTNQPIEVTHWLDSKSVSEHD